jgi:ATP-dependent Lhr-like helicase
LKLQTTPGYKIIKEWLTTKGYKAFVYQEQAWQQIINGQSGLVNAPTGTGKTFSVFLGAVIQYINQYPTEYTAKSKNGLQLIWVTPLRALAKDIGRAMEEVIFELGMKWQVGIRNGDTSLSDRSKQKRLMPEVLIITPESMHLLLAQKENGAVFTSLKIIAVDEWHELIGSKRGIQVELAISRMTATARPCIWGISATIGNLEEAKDVLLAPLNDDGTIIRAQLNKKLEIESILPDEIEKYPWAGHLGIRLAEKVLPVIEASRTTLIFINTRGMSELWYQTLLTIAPHLAGAIALHHGSIEKELRTWVEEALHDGKLKAVVCTASLDLGVDFRPVETVIQVGSPKGVARFLQRAGRSGHSPDATSKIYFLPTHSLELIEAAALKKAVGEQFIESRPPLMLCYDVLVQYLGTLACGDGFYPDVIYEEVKRTFCYRDLTKEEWNELLYFITSGGNALQQYDEYKKVEVLNGSTRSIAAALPCVTAYISELL